MAKKISSKDLFDQEDIFKGIRDSAEKTLVSLNKINQEFKETATTLKQSLGEAKFDSSESIKKFTQATAEANKIQKQAIEIEKLKEQVKQQAIKSEKEQERLAQERIKTQKAEAQEKARLTKESEKAAKAAAQETGTLAKLEAANKSLRAERRKLNLETEEGQQRLKEINVELDKNNTFIKENSDSLKQQSLNVGNYEGATRNLKKELRELTKALMNMDSADPRFQEMAQRAGELKDQISDTQAVVKATAGSAMENLAGSVAKVGQIGIAAFQGIQSSMVLLGVENENILQSMAKLQALAGLGDAMKVLGAIGDELAQITAGITAFGSKAISAFNGLTTAGKAFAVTGIGLIVTAIGYAIANFDKLSAAISNQTTTQRVANEVNKKAIEGIIGELSAADRLSKVLKDETISREEKIKNVKEFQAQYPGLLSNMNTERNSIAEINNQLGLNIKLLGLQAKEKAIATIREEEYKKAIIAQTNSLEDNLGTYGTISMAITGFLGIQEENRDEYEKIANYNKQTAINEAQTRIDALDKLHKSNQAAIDAVMQQGAVVVDTNKATVNSYQAVAPAVAKTTQEIVDFTNQIRDEQIKQIEDDKQRRITQTIEDAKRRKQEIKATVADATQKAKLLQLIEDNMLIEIGKITDEYSQIEYDKEKEHLQRLEELRNEAIANEKRRQDELLNEAETFTEERQRLFMSEREIELRDLEDWYFEKKEIHKKNDKALDDLEILYLNKRNDINLKYQDIEDKNTDDFNKKIKEKEQKANEERYKTVQDFAQKTTDFFKQQSDKRIAQIDKEINAAQKQSDYYKELAAQGNINAQQSLAEQERIIAEANRRKEREQKNQQRLELANSILQTYSGYAAKDPDTALVKTIRDASLLQAFIQSLPMFYDGTEDTGTNGRGVDGKGGFHAVLHPNERVIPKSLNDQIGGLTNEELTRIATQYQSGRLVGHDVAHSSLELAVLVNEMKDLKEVIKRKPETNIELGEITQSAMEIVKSTRQGNTIVYNRFKVRK